MQMVKYTCMQMHDRFHALCNQWNRRRRKIQEAYNAEHGIIPTTVKKNVEEAIRGKETKEMAAKYMQKKAKLSQKDKAKLIADMEVEMREAAASLNFERAAELRDILFELKSE